MRLRILLALSLLFGLGATARAQSSPYSNVIFKAQTFTATGQTGTPIQLNGLTVSSTVGSSFSSGTITVTGSSLTTATFSVQGSSDNGATYYALPISAVASPGSTPTLTVTATGNALYQVNLAGLTHIRFVTSGTFTATNAILTLTASPNAQVSKSSGGGGVTAGAMQAALAGQTGCTSSGNFWVPASNTCLAPSGMVYPATGVPCSTGSAWCTSYSTTGAGNVLALQSGPTFLEVASASHSYAVNVQGVSGVDNGNAAVSYRNFSGAGHWSTDTATSDAVYSEDGTFRIFNWITGNDIFAISPTAPFKSFYIGPYGVVLSSISSGTKPVCANGTGGALTSSGCVPKNVYYVGLSGTDYTSISAAITAINAGTAPTFTNQSTIYVYPGIYTTTSPIVVPQYVNIIGINKWAPVQLQNNSTNIFTASGFNTFQNLVILQGITASTYAFDAGNNTDISILDTNMWGMTVGPGQGFLHADGTSWARITVQDSTINSYATSGYMIEMVNRTTTARFCDSWFRNLFLDSYQLTNFGGGLDLWAVQDVRVENSTIRGSNTWNTSVRLGKAPVTSGTPQVEIRNSYTTGGVSIFNEAGTIMNVLNSDCAGAATSGTQLNHNSYLGAAYNALGPI